jgi:tRNA(adenine34) deaminase
MKRALELARQAGEAGEVPVGAVVVLNNLVVGEGFNQPIGARDPSAHAEIVALRAACGHFGNYRLPSGCRLYVTLEPCAMCAGAMLHARLGELVFGAKDTKAGAAGGSRDLFTGPGVNHQVRVSGGVLAEPCAEILNDFFSERRNNE